MRGKITMIAVAISMGTAPARAADPAAVQTPVKGADVMGDKGRAGPDGMAWAPQVRDQAANPAGTNKTGENTSKQLAPGDDPGTPVATASHGPGTLDSAPVQKP